MMGEHITTPVCFGVVQKVPVQIPWHVSKMRVLPGFFTPFGRILRIT
jgi:hypothetical protein